MIFAPTSQESLEMSVISNYMDFIPYARYLQLGHNAH